MSASTVIVVPCYDEAGRLDPARFEEFAARYRPVEFLFVNDGSRDDTLRVLQELESRDAARFHVLDQQPNRGKAEAVRRGMLEALARGPGYVGYWDADLATPLDEIPRFVEVLEERPERLAVFGSRVQLLGRSIRRSAVRHYLGRVFATLASNLLELAVYDTQCGAKLFRATPETEALFHEPFRTSWIFDVEVLARLIRSRRAGSLPPVSEAIFELPLRRWHDVAGSKVSLLRFWQPLVELARIRRHYLR